jgi:hypothetical protein
MTVTGPNTAIAVSDLRELEERAAKLEVAARKLPIGPGRDELFEDIARFRAQVAGLKARRFYGHQATAEGEGEMTLIC